MSDDNELDLRVRCYACGCLAEAHDSGGCTQCACDHTMRYVHSDVLTRLDELSARAKRLEKVLAPRTGRTLS